MDAVHKCPVCDGTGLVSRPPGIAGDQQTWNYSSAGPFPCNVCKGAGVVWIQVAKAARGGDESKVDPLVADHVSQIPCRRCGGPVVEFVVPNEVWNPIVRKNGPETDREYLCVRCFGEMAAKEIKRLQERIKAEYQRGVEEGSSCQAILEIQGRERFMEGLKSKSLDEVERLQAIVDTLPKCWRLNEEGELVQDVPVVPGMVVFWVSLDTGCIYEREVTGIGKDLSVPNSADPLWGVKFGDGGSGFARQCAITRAAAEAAEGK